MAEKGKGGTVHLKAALEYAAGGCAVFPVYEPHGDGLCSCKDPACTKPGKHPRIRGGFSNATTDPATITRWWTQWPNANIGLATGAVSGFWVLDLDAKPGAPSLEELERQFGTLSTDHVVSTGSGGLHLYFRYGASPVRCRTGILPGVDVRGDGGYVIAPPSVHANMNTYKRRSS